MLEDAVIQLAQSRVGRVLREKWRLDALLGVGGMACVYAATHRNGLRGAVKMLHPELAMRVDIRQRFFREGYVANKVDHPGAVRVLDDDTDESGGAFIVMELLEGESLEARAKARPEGTLDVTDVLIIADALLDVLASAHDKGVVHRDLKPENLFMTRQNQLKVLDFGIARIRDLSSTSNATSTGSVMGTPAFMPPEQALGKMDLIDGRTDLWAVGATLFTLLTGQPVHAAENTNQLLLAAMTHPARSIASVRRDLPVALVQLIDRALAFHREQRWPDARTMQASLRIIAPGAITTVSTFAVSPVTPSSGVIPAPVSNPGYPGPGSGQPMPSSPAGRSSSPSGPGPGQIALGPHALEAGTAQTVSGASHISSFNVANASQSQITTPKKRGPAVFLAFVVGTFAVGGALALVLLRGGSSSTSAASTAAAASPAASAAPSAATSDSPPPSATPAAASAAEASSAPAAPAPSAQAPEPSSEPAASAAATAPVSTPVAAGKPFGHLPGRGKLPTAPTPPPPPPANAGHKDHGF